MGTVRVCAGVITWQDGPALANAARSLAGCVDEIAVADGLIDGVDPEGLPWYSPLADLRAVSGHVETRLWRSQAEMRQWTLEEAGRLSCDWLIVVDADEQLHDGTMLRGYLDTVAGAPAAPLPVGCTVTPGGRLDGGPLVQARCWQRWRLLQVEEWRYAYGATVFEDTSGRTVELDSAGYGSDVPPGVPYLTHHPELRPERRQRIRLRHFVEPRLDPPRGVGCG